MEQNTSWILLFDNDCSVCNQFIKIARQLAPQNLLTVPLQEYALSQQDLSYNELMAEVHLISPDNTVYKGKDAVHQVVLIAPSLKPFRWMIDSRWGEKTSAAVYASISKFRRCRTCT